MDIKKEIRKIVEYQNSIVIKQEKKNCETLEEIITRVYNDYSKANLNFSSFRSITLKQDGKSRLVKQYSSFSSEDILCIYLKRMLDQIFHVTYPNRNVFMRTAFDKINALKDMTDFTIFRFDFADFFNSVSSVYVYEKYIKNKSLERYQIDLLQKFVYETKYAYAGLNTSNIICEIIAKKFDDVLLQRLSNKGLIFYKRYIDDGIIIFNRFISNATCKNIIDETIQEVFYDRTFSNLTQCKTELNLSKMNYITIQNLATGYKIFDFLGYEFQLELDGNNRLDIKYGITDKKMKKYKKRIENIVKLYVDSEEHDIELLRHRIKAFSHRIVYRVNWYNGMLWKSKGFISNYGELRYRIDKLTPKTKTFLKTVIYNAFKNNDVELPYFMRGESNESIYSLYNNMKKNKTLLFVDKIGIGLSTLKRLCQQLGIDITNKKTYDSLVREYLIKVKVGH